MALPYNYPSENISSILGLFDYVNELTEGFMGIGLLIVIGMVSFLSTRTFGNEKAFSFSVFILLLSAILLRFMNLIENKTFFVITIIFIFVLIWIWFHREEESS